jgi:hypothetical protein
MAIPEDRLSTEVVEAPFIPPEQEDRLSFKHDVEGGPIAIGNTSEGMNYQVWDLNYVANDIILTPRTSGLPSTIITVSGAQQISFCFDQNARPSIVYLTDSCYLYWYDSVVANFVTTEFTGVKSAMLSLDDKRIMQVGANDIIFWYTKEVSPGVYNLYHRKQRDRFLDEYLMAEGVFPYVWKSGMHEGIRGQIILAGSQQSSGVPPTLPPTIDPQANLNFELGDVYWNKTGDFVIDQVDPYAGNWSARLDTVPANLSELENTVYTALPALESPVFISCVAKGSAATTVKFGFRVYNSVKSLISTETVVKNITTDWAQLVHSFLAPSNAVYVRAFVESNSTDGTVLFDNFTYANVIDTGAFFEVELDATVYMKVEQSAEEFFEVEA